MKCQLNTLLQKVLLALACYSVSSSMVYAERYSVEKDSFGGYSAKKVETPPAIDEKETVDEKTLSIEDTSTNVSDEAVKIASPEQDNAKTDRASDNIVKQTDILESSEESSVSQTISPELRVEEEEPRKLSIFEQKYLEAELAERERILNEIKSGKGKPSDYDATLVNPDDFVDSEELLRSADRPVKERSPYYVTVDVDGRPQTTFYDPALVKEILFTERNKKLEYTDAQVYREADAKISVPESADPVALSILMGGKDKFVSYFEKFSEKCCDQLPNIQTPELSVDNYHYFVLSDDSLPYRFAEGDSRFLLLQLPYVDQPEIPIRIRTFIRRFADQNIERGVFFPQIVTLDKNKKPLRIITGPLLKFHEETWTTHAYLQGIFALSQTRELDERYLLINTTRETMASPSTIEMPSNKKGSARSVTLQHMNEGSFEIEILL